MRMLSVFICLFLVASYLPQVEMKRSKRKAKQMKDTDSENVKGDKRTREIIPDDEFKHSSPKKDKRKKDELDKEDLNGGYSNSGGSKKLRGSKRQKKKERKKHKSREKAERNSGGQHGIINDHRKHAYPKGAGHPSQEDGKWSLVKAGIKALSNWFSGEETKTKGTYRSDRLRCSDKLNSQLVKFYEEEIRVPLKDVETSRSIVNQFMKQLWTPIISNMEGLMFGDYTLVGSMAEDLAAMKPSDFDFHLPLEISSGKLTAHDVSDIPGYKLISCDVCGEYVEVKDGRNFLSPALIISKLQSIVQKAVVNKKVAMLGDCHQYRPGYKGPTVAVELDCGTETYRLELVPLITTVDGQQFVAKKASFGLDTSEPLSWRQSFQQQERDFIARKSSDDLSMLRLAKALLLHIEKSLKYLSSYHLKNTYCHLDRSGYNWSTKVLCDQLLDFIHQLHTFAVKRNLPSCFYNGINLFSFHSVETFINMERRLKKILENYEETVKRWIGIPELKDEL